MIKGDRLYDVIEFILNEASEKELEVVRSALKRRIEGNRRAGAMGVDLGRIAHRTASNIREQMGLSIDQIRSMVTGYAVEIIKKNAPELKDEQIHDLIGAWIPEPTENRSSAAGASVEGAVSGRAAGGGSPAGDAAQGRSGGTGGGGLAPDVVLTMVMQFLTYSDESMSITEQVRLNQEIPDWQKRYWEQFSLRIRELLSLHLRGQIDRSTCLDRICADLGIDADFSK